MRRTFYGGGFYLASGKTFEVEVGEITEVEQQLTETGHTISGRLIDPEGEPVNMTVILVDENGLILGASPPLSDDGSYFLNGVPNGAYKLLATRENQGYLVSTWYPDVLAPGASMKHFAVLDEAQIVDVMGADLTDVDIRVQPSQILLNSAPDIRRLDSKIDDFKICDLFPNPFNSVLSIRYEQSRLGRTSVSVYDLKGRRAAELFNGQLPAGEHNFTWVADGHAAGMYVVTIVSGQFSESRKVVYLK